ncbi:MAG: hypothetical protein ACRD3F_11710 [Acidobacteriaceae bacterium]
MKRQNPPQASLDQALAIECFLRPAPLVAIYLVCATAAFAVLALLLVILFSENVLNPAGNVGLLLLLLGLGPAVMAFVEFWRRPDDLLSAVIRNLANSRRKPIGVNAERCNFKVLLRTGEPMCANLTFQFPAEDHLPEVREYILSYVRLSLERYASMLTELPPENDVRDVVDRALDTVAGEYRIPVLYSEVLSLQKIRDAYSRPDDLPTRSEHVGLATGTLG